MKAFPDLDGDGIGQVIVGAQQLSSGSDKLLFVLDADSGLPCGGPELNPSGALTLGSTLQLALSAATPGHTAFTVLGFDPALVPLGAKGTLAIDPGLDQRRKKQGSEKTKMRRLSVSRSRPAQRRPARLALPALGRFRSTESAASHGGAS